MKRDRLLGGLDTCSEHASGFLEDKPEASSKQQRVDQKRSASTEPMPSSHELSRRIRREES